VRHTSSQDQSVPCIEERESSNGHLQQSHPFHTLEVEADGRILKVPVVLRNPTTETSDVIFDITNANRVLGNLESLELWIFTNERVNPMTPYFVQIKNKDQLLY
jgi:hypothetical protein